MTSASDNPDSPGVPGSAAASAAPAGGRNLPAAIITGILLAGLLFGTLFWHPLAFTTLVAVLVGIAAIEAGVVLRQHQIRVAVPPLLVAGLVTIYATYRSGHAGQVVGMLVLFLATAAWLLADPHRRDVVQTLTVTVMLGMWTALLGSFAVLLVHRPEDGPAAVLAVILPPVLGDIGGFAFGVRFGRHRIAPSISPKKSLEGLLGGVIVAAVGTALLVPAIGDVVTPLQGALLGVVGALIGLGGDLTESMIKRDLGIKDLGAIIPGHGGVLDRVDGILVALPIGFFLLELLR